MKEKRFEKVVEYKNNFPVENFFEFIGLWFSAFLVVIFLPLVWYLDSRKVYWREIK